MCYQSKGLLVCRAAIGSNGMRPIRSRPRGQSFVLGDYKYSRITDSSNFSRGPPTDSTSSGLTEAHGRTRCESCACGESARPATPSPGRPLRRLVRRSSPPSPLELHRLLVFSRKTLSTTPLHERHGQEYRSPGALAAYSARQADSRRGVPLSSLQRDETRRDEQPHTTR